MFYHMDVTYTNGEEGIIHYRKFFGKGNKIALILLHGIESNSAWFEHLAKKLVENSIDCYCPDRRGSGYNGKSRGDIDSFSTWLNDLDDFIADTVKGYERVYLLGLSWGGKL